MSPERERLEEIRERVEAATEGPWKLAGKHAGYWIEAPGRLCIPHAKSDTIFIANARADIPWLLDQLEQAEQREKGLREALRQIAQGEPEATKGDVEAGVYPMLNRTHEVHLYQRIAERAIVASIRARKGLAAQSKESEDSRA